ncbi:hypothetical protein NIES2100_39840 [Calothrix sp. NIES-2100]|uniref:TrbI/VirB10 family protein n=1 Tax=Calothrix sp. NIES-2100 TaxID=1954172 RepID=UPI000B615272|nr:hypothetical protein NIES2100_39840 [Calothrix sp. NIES-2100]
MTQSPIIPDDTKKNVSNHQSDNYSLGVDAGDWELRMAKLVGLEPESLSTDAEVIEESANKEPSPSHPIEEKTEQSLSPNPFAKLGLVGTATLAIVLFAGGFLTQMMSNTQQKPKNNHAVARKTRSPTLQQSREPNLEEKVETLKTKLALTEQAEAVKLAQQQLRGGKQISPSFLGVPRNLQMNASSRQTVVQKTPTPMSTVYVPRIVTVERIVKSPSSQPYSQPAPTSSLPQAIIVNPQTPPPTPNLLQIWQNLAKLGSYGQMGVSEQSHVNVTPKPQQNNDEGEQQTTNPNPEQTSNQQTAVVSQAVQQSPKSLVVGSHAKAVLATAVFGETSKSENGDRTNVFVVRLKEPLKAFDGAIAFPANTELLTQLSSVSEQGLVQLDVVKVILPIQGQLTQRDLPPNALMIRAPQGKPLIANQFPNRGSSIASMDMGLFVLGGLGKAAELSNRSQSQVVTTSGSTTIVNNTNPERNIVAGIFEGGINTVVPQMAQRNQQAISQMTQRTNIWFLSAGTAVEIYVNQAMQF